MKNTGKYIACVTTPIGQMTVTTGTEVMLKKYQRNIENYFNKKKITLSFEDFELQGTPFQQKVLKTLFDIPYGETISYSELAKRAGKPKAVRVVASVVASNKHYIFIPCHRVIASDGTLGGYGAGLDRKLWLLRHEGSML